MPKVVLVTGATGFVGRHVVKALVDEGYSVRALARRTGREEAISFPGVEVRYVDVLDPRAVRDVVEGVFAVVNLVAIIKERRGATFQDINYLATANVVTSARGAGVQRFIHMGAVGSSDDAKFPYWRSKWLGEQAVVSSHIPYTVLRGSLIFGPGDEFINKLAGVVKASPMIPVVGGGHAKFQPVHVEDVARCIVTAIQRDDLKNQTLEIGGPEILTFDDIADTIARTYSLRRFKLHIPIRIMRLLVWALQRLLPNPPLTLHQLDMLTLDNVTELDGVEGKFGFTPRSLGDNIGYIEKISRFDAFRIALGCTPKHVRDH